MSCGWPLCYASVRERTLTFDNDKAIGVYMQPAVTCRGRSCSSAAAVENTVVPVEILRDRDGGWAEVVAWRGVCIPPRSPFSPSPSGSGPLRGVQQVTSRPPQLPGPARPAPPPAVAELNRRDLVLTWFGLDAP